MKYAILCVILVIASYVYYKIADRFNIIDKPNHRSSHTSITIRGGGIIFYIAVLLFFIVSNFQYPYFFIATTLIGLLSFIDDIKPLPPSSRLPIQFFSVILVLLQLQADIHFLYYVPLLIVGVGFINAFNFMDGINGITGLYGLSILGGLLFFNTYEVHFMDQDLLLLLIFSVVVFLFYNFRKKALFFAGDVGSITLAMCVLFCVIKLYVITNAPAVLLLVAVYGADSVLTIIRRIKMKEKITDAHRHHLYQNMVDSRIFSHLQVASMYAIVQLFLVILFVYCYSSTIIYQLIITFVVLFFLSLLYFVTIKIFSKKTIK